MQTHIVAAVDVNGVFAIDGKIPWHSPEDLKKFKELTINYGRSPGDPPNAVIMGRKTAESLPNGFLKERVNIVISRSYPLLPVLWAHDLEDALHLAESVLCLNAFVIGGHNIWHEAMKIADRLFLTIFHDAYFYKHAAIHQYFPYYWAICEHFDEIIIPPKPSTFSDLVEMPDGNSIAFCEIDLAALRHLQPAVTR